jgi:hypothetical protein
MDTREFRLGSCDSESCDVKQSPTLFCWLIRATGLGLALLAGICLSQATARASCGDYLVHHAVAATPDLNGSATLPAPLDHKRPCSGPNCSSRSEPMPLVPITVPPQNGEQWGWFTLSDQIEPPDMGSPVSLTPPVYAIYHCSPLERPPRLNSFAASI